MASNQAFNSIQANRLKRAAHDLSHSRKFTMNMGDLVPIMVQDVIPGDSFQVKMEALVRMMPMIAPIYHNVNVYMHFFFVPNRIIWNEWEDFITGGKNGNSSPTFPKFYNDTAQNFTPKLGVGTLADYLGFPSIQIPNSPISIPSTQGFSELPFRAYHTIYNEYYRDQNLEDEIPISLNSGSTLIGAGSNNWANAFYTMRKRAWEKDYFTSALPWTQRGTQMSIPVTGDPAVYAKNSNEKRYLEIGDAITGLPNPGLSVRGLTIGGVQPITGSDIYADMSTVSTATINDLRQAFQIQKWMERSARSGSRYTEVLQSFFGVSPRDSRLQRPEFLGGGKMPLSVSEVLQTSESGTTALGEFAGHGISYGSTARFRKFFTEHGIVMGIMSVIPRTAYCQGLPKIFSKFDRYDYFWQEFAHLGEQQIKNKEIYYSPSDAVQNEGTFGYTARYNEYRYQPDTIHGNMLNSLSYWHMGRMFTALPVLNKTFVQSDPTTRIFPVQDSTHKLIIQTYAQFKAIRPVPKYGEPLGV